MKTLEGKLVAKGMRVGIVAARFNEFITSKLLSGAMGGLRPAVIGMIGAAVVSVGQTVFLPEGLAAVTAYPLVCSLAIFALMAVLTHKKLHPIVIILLSALLGMCTKYCEVTLSVKYRERNKDGDWVGGPMYYIRNGLGKKWT